MPNLIFKPKLPPKAGYFETEDDGIRRYVAVDPNGPMLATGYDLEKDCFITLQLPIEEARAQKLAELSAATEASIYAGIDVTTAAFGTLHYTLDAHDQSQLEFISGYIEKGNPGYLYNGTGQDHEYYSAADLMLIVMAGAEFITYSRTYYSELKKWVNRETDMSGIFYGATLPDDLAQDLSAKLAMLSANG